jgi:D-aminoacyl-tRNA deacylase
VLLVVASLADEASVNIRDRLLEVGGWSEAGTFDGSPAWRRGDRTLVTLREHHLYVDDVDAKARDALAVTADAVAVVSKHRASSGQGAFTVHPIGNWRAADFGGRAGEVVPAAPGLMTDALRRLAAGANAFHVPATFESTHHGPYLGTPTFYIEIGSGPERWADRDAAGLIARTVLAAEDPGDPVAIGVGGGHYLPRVTDVALARRISFGHLVPSHALEPPDWTALGRAVERTPRARFVYFHRKALAKPLLRELERFFRDRGLEAVHEADLAPRAPTPQSL